MSYENVWVMHPEFGFVCFSNTTARQKEVLEEYGYMYRMEHGVDHDKIVENFIDEKEEESGKKEINTTK